MDARLVLKKNVVVPDGGKASQLRYASVDRDALKAYLASLSKVKESEFKGWPREERMAFPINAYNAFTVEKILTRYPDIRSATGAWRCRFPSWTTTGR